MKKVRILTKKASQIRARQIRVSQIRASQIRASQIRASQIRASQIRASQIRASEISSNHRELHGAIFIVDRRVSRERRVGPEGCGRKGATSGVKGQRPQFENSGRDTGNIVDSINQSINQSINHRAMGLTSQAGPVSAPTTTNQVCVCRTRCTAVDSQVWI